MNVQLLNMSDNEDNKRIKTREFLIDKNKIVPYPIKNYKRFQRIRTGKIIMNLNKKRLKNKVNETNEKKSPNTEKMNKIILDNNELREKQQKIEHNIVNSIKDLDKQIDEYKVKINNLKKKKKEYNEMKDKYNNESFLSKNCVII